MTAYQLFQGPLLLLTASTRPRDNDSGIRMIQGRKMPVCWRMESLRLKSTKVLCVH